MNEHLCGECGSRVQFEKFILMTQKSLYFYDKGKYENKTEAVPTFHEIAIVNSTQNPKLQSSKPPNYAHIVYKVVHILWQNSLSTHCNMDMFLNIRRGKISSLRAGIHMLVNIFLASLNCHAGKMVEFELF